MRVQAAVVPAGGALPTGTNTPHAGDDTFVNTPDGFNRPLPARPRLLHLETPSSYLHRLMTMNELPSGTLGYWIAQTHVVASDLTPDERISLVAVAKGRLEPAAFEHARVHIPKHPDGTTCPRLRRWRSWCARTTGTR